MIQIQSNVPTISQRIQRVADSLATVISGGINEAAEMEVQQKEEDQEKIF